MSEHIIELNHISKSFDGFEALSDINFYIRKNEFITLLGPSGCGKTTMLRIIGGFESADRGEVIFEGKSINNLPPYKRAVNTVFQKYALFTHMNVYENVAFGLKVKKLPKSEIKERVSSMLELVGLKGYESRSVDKMSGGQQQRVAIARALVNHPQVLLLDEPLGALDLKLRKEMQIELKKMQQRVGITFIYVTHDQEEALTMSDTIVVMNHGKIQQIGTPVDIYNEPKNRFVASFIGESNIIGGVMPEDRLVLIEDLPFKCVDSGFGANEDVDVVIRPEDLMMLRDGDGRISGLVTTVTFKGVHYEHIIKDDLGFTWKAHSTVSFPEGSRVGLDVLPENIQIMKKGEAE